MKKAKYLSNGEKQTLRFTITYNEDNPIAVKDFTCALDGLNQLYSSFVHNQRYSKEIDQPIDVSKKESNDIFPETIIKKIFNKNDKEEELGQFYIKEIKPGSILCLLTVMGAVNLVSFLGGIAGIISLSLDIYDRLDRRRKNNSLKREKKDRLMSDSKIEDIIKNLSIESLILVKKIIQPIQQGQSITIEVEGKKLIIDYNKKLIIEDILSKLTHDLTNPLSSLQLRREFVQIERIKGKYYATVINNPMGQLFRLPVIFHTDFNMHKMLFKQYSFRDLIFEVDIELGQDTVPKKYDIYYIYRVFSWRDYIIDIYRMF